MTHKLTKHADKTLKSSCGVWGKDQKAMVVKGKITEYLVPLKVSFVLKTEQVSNLLMGLATEITQIEEPPSLPAC